ncbi:MAG: hypothetical protein ACYTFG_08995 [Planctomycetota bacterium]|jgi:hypothetical protein
MKKWTIFLAVLVLIGGCMEGSEAPAPAQENPPQSEENSTLPVPITPGSPKEAWELLRQRALEEDWEGVWNLCSKDMQELLEESMTELQEDWKEEENPEEVEMELELTYAELIAMEPKKLCFKFLEVKVRHQDPSAWTFVDETTKGKVSTIRFETGKGKDSMVFVEAENGWLLSMKRGPHPGGKIGGNEAFAIGSLKAICTGQEQFKSAVCVDFNANGVGEYGFLDELGGTAPCRRDNDGVLKGEQFSASPYIPRVLGTLDPRGIATKSGYCFILYLASSPYTATASASEQTEVPITEISYICYAWPVEKGKSGNQMFVIDPQGQPYSLADSPHSGPNDPPAWDFALNKGSTWDSYIDGGGPGQSGMDRSWVPVG